MKQKTKPLASQNTVMLCGTYRETQKTLGVSWNWLRGGKWCRDTAGTAKDITGQKRKEIVAGATNQNELTNSGTK